jgi:hypothetical protein
MSTEPNGLSPLILRESHNYVAFFLTLDCNQSCGYCLTRHHFKTTPGSFDRYDIPAQHWIAAANRLVLPASLPITLQGGEPSLYPGFFEFVRGVADGIRLDLLTNLAFDVDLFVDRVPVEPFLRDAPYPSIRATYHPGQTDIRKMIVSALKLMKAGFRIGIYAIEYPDKTLMEDIEAARSRCKEEGIDFRTKEYLGTWNGRLHGTYKYEGAVNGAHLQACLCRVSELLVGPDLSVYRCHSDLYRGRKPIGSMLDPAFSARDIDRPRPCRHFGDCNPCDVKITTNKHQQSGYTSVVIELPVETPPSEPGSGNE